jgi:hypothetical protein
MTSISPLQLAFYKGMGGKWGAVQFNKQEAHYFCPKCKARIYNHRLPPDPCVNGPDQGGSCTGGKMQAREGCIFLEITSARGKNEYDWDSKIIIALSIEDLGKVLLVLTGVAPECKLMHDPGARTTTQGKVQKWLTISSPKGIQEGVLIMASEKGSNSEEPLKHTVPLSASEVKVLEECLRTSIPSLVAW